MSRALSYLGGDVYSIDIAKGAVTFVGPLGVMGSVGIAASRSAAGGRHRGALAGLQREVMALQRLALGANGEHAVGPRRDLEVFRQRARHR
jgi:hypothetical protein